MMVSLSIEFVHYFSILNAIGYISIDKKLLFKNPM